MNIIKIKPDLSDLREYLQEAEDAGFGFSRILGEYRKAEFLKHIYELDAGAIKLVLGKHNLNPEYLYFITDNKNRRLSEQMIFTGVADLNLEKALVVFESFNSQIYYMFKGSGECILGPCHDLDLGYGGLIQYRNSGGDPVFQMKNIHDPEFHKTRDVCPFEHFPYTKGCSYLDKIEEKYFNDPRINILKNGDRKYILERVKKNGWSLQFVSAELKDDEEVVAEACISKSGALLFASERIRCNKKFIADLLIKTSGHIYSFISQELQKAPEIIKTMNALEKKGYLPF